MNFAGQRGPKMPVILPRHKQDSGETRKKQHAAKKRTPIRVILDWYAR